MPLELKGINVSLGGHAILHDINLHVQKGELFSLLGPSGCGKSTLLKTIAGLLDEEAGEIWLEGQRLNDIPPHKRQMTLVFQDLRLFPHLSAAENIAFPLKMAGLAKKQRLEQAARMLEVVQLAGFDRRRISEMSGGQQQRVVLARAIIAQPKLLLLDEPFSSLDEELRGDMRQLLLRLHAEFGMTTILVTHDRREAYELSDRLAVMRAGRILFVGTPDEVSARLATVEPGSGEVGFEGDLESDLAGSLPNDRAGDPAGDPASDLGSED